MTTILRAETKALPAGWTDAIRTLVDDAFEGDFDDHDWAHSVGGWHVVAEEGGLVVSHASVVARRIEVGPQVFAAGYLEAVATRPDRQGQGIGTRVVAEATAIVRDRYELGALGTGRHSFYEHLGWERWQGPTYVRHGSGLVRSPEDDDGVMVLRFGPSAGIDLTGPIACEARDGDDW